MASLELSSILTTPILEPIDATTVARLITAVPFVAIPGVANVRDLGGLPVTNHRPIDEHKEKPLQVRTGKVFRSAQLNLITPEGRERLRSLNLGAVFDFRTVAEVRKYGGVLPEETNPSAGFLDFTQEGVELYHIPMVDIKKLTPEEVMAMIAQYASGDDGFVKDYEKMLEVGGKSFGTIMRYILQQTRLGDDGKACIWHCHVGKDRTGVFSALLLELLGVPDEAIAQDYALTRIGLEPIREDLLVQWQLLVTSNPQAAVSLASSNASVMMKFLQLLRTKYGGARGWFLEASGLTEEELDEIRASLIVEPA